MTYFQTIQDDYTLAFKARDAISKAALSYVLSQLKNKAKELGREPNDEETVKILQKEVKILNETAVGYQTQWYVAQYEEETAKMEVLKKYLPTMLSEAELYDIVESKQRELGILDQDIGKSKWRLIGTIMKEYGSTVDGGMLNRILSDKS